LESHPSIEKMFWAFYRDIDNMFPDGAGYMGLVRDDLSPKPAYFAYQKLIRDHGF
jgi:hypothetical protein